MASSGPKDASVCVCEMVTPTTSRSEGGKIGRTNQPTAPSPVTADGVHRETTVDGTDG